MRSDEVGGGQVAAKALESIGLASSIRRHGYRYRGYFCHPCIRGYWIQWIQLYRGYHSMCILAKRWYPRLYPWIRLYSCHSRAGAERLCQLPRSILRSADLIPCGGGMKLQSLQARVGMAATDEHLRYVEETPCSRRCSCGGFERPHPAPCASTHPHEEACATEIDRIQPFSPIC